MKETEKQRDKSTEIMKEERKKEIDKKTNIMNRERERERVRKGQTDRHTTKVPCDWSLVLTRARG